MKYRTNFWAVQMVLLMQFHYDCATRNHTSNQEAYGQTVEVSPSVMNELKEQLFNILYRVVIYILQNTCKLKLDTCNASRLE